jgi:hypothetical protein
MPLHRHYNRNLIDNAGEKAFDQALEDLHDDPDRTWHVCHAVRVGRHPTKKTAEHDFVLVTRQGVVVVEVKGGIVGMRNGQFLHLPDDRVHFSERPFQENPLHQAQGCAASLIQWCKEKEVRDTLVTPAVAFPMCAFGHADGAYRIIWSKATAEPLAEFLLGVLSDARRTAPWARDLAPELQQRLVAAFTPTVMPQHRAAQLQVGTDLADRRMGENDRILDGLAENRRIMVQGPPGSGKSPYALRHMQRMAAKGLRGLYLCWNELLAAHMRHRVQEAGLQEQVTVCTYYGFVEELLAAAGLHGRLRYDALADVPALLQEAFATLGAAGNLPQWDHLVVDEGQDLFHLGIDRVLDACLGGDGVAHGRYLVLYDLSHADAADLSTAYTRLLQCAAHYRLADHYRGTGGDGLNRFVEAVERGTVDLDAAYGADVSVVRYARVEDVPHLAYTHYLTHCGGQADPTRAALLLHSSLLGDGAGGVPTLREALAADARYEPLTPENLAQPATGLRYTTPLKFKGLSRPLVILVLPPTLKWDRKLHNQFLVGAGRASVKLCVLAPQGV